MNSIQLCLRQNSSSERSVYSYHMQPRPIFTYDTSFKVCQIDHRFEHFGHLFMLLTIASKNSHSDSQTNSILIYERQSETDELSFQGKKEN